MDKITGMVRKLHLYASVIIASFLLMYFLTGAVMIMGKIFPRKNVSEISEKIALKQGDSADEMVSQIKKKYDIHGSETMLKRPGGFSLNITRPAYKAEIIFNEKENILRVNVRKATFWAAMNDFHRLRGYAGWAHKIWAVIYDLTCVALIVFALTGVILWWKIESKKFWGTVVIILSTGITVFTIWYLFTIG